MNDLELLELAARAAGFTGYGFFLGDDGIDVSDETGTRFAWNPLTDDGDALRLAASLEMDLRFIGAGAIARAHFENSIWPKIKDDDYKRAIVRAAAEIGKSMGGGE
ncbi:hypothetical protein [Pseudomonas aeruginosa]|uniref:hypothetical protein n=1 Tax=Pseudomonas aeruginosa TaxID=287 RepID=UPI001574E2F1|nr:hypothetical protein [Pseudomonas aeruginosa]NTT99379.1 hypothetical protein [Pseudomonas aeruginosa]